MSDELLRIKQAATRLGVNPKTLRRWLKAGRISHVLLPNGERRIPLDVIEAALKRRCA